MPTHTIKNQICSRCVMDTSVPDIIFDNSGECNYCKVHDALDQDNPNDERGKENLERIVSEIKRKSRNREYDVLVGVSGGTDSTYLLHLSKELGLRPLAVHLDNGWNSEISVSNLKNCLDVLKIDLKTYVINWNEIRDILKSFILARLPWADGPTDIAITSILYKTAAQYNIKYIFAGNNFRTEGKQPDLWSHVDSKTIIAVQKQFGTLPLKTFPNLSPFGLVWYGMVKGIKMVRPFYFMKYNKTESKKLITEKYHWKDYGGHHHENVFTRFIIGFWLVRKFGIDKRKVTYSALVRSSELTRTEAIEMLSKPPYEEDRMQSDKEYVCKKLGFTIKEFDDIVVGENKSVLDYPSYFPLYLRFKKLATSIFKYILPFRPMMTYDISSSKKQNFKR